MIKKANKKKSKAKKKAKKILSPDEKKKRKIKRDHIKLIRDIFKTTGFQRVSSISDKEITFKGSTSDFDDAFLYENILVLAEYTTSQESDVSGHLKNKKILYDKVNKSKTEFVDFLKGKFPEFVKMTKDVYDPKHYKIIILYCSLNSLKNTTKADFPDVKFLDYNVARYFKSVTQTVRKSARFELFGFLNLKSEDIGELALQPPGHPTDVYQGSVLPEDHSNLGPGFKVVSFYANPESLLERSYVLRKHGWQSGANVYQRMISKKKVETVRKYLIQNKRVFVNNIIVTLPDETKLLDKSNNTIDVSSIAKTQPARIQIPKKYNSVGIVDGQHRVFSYHEGGSQDIAINKLRKQQNLLVTGIIFPSKMDEDDRSKFEARLFLEINSNQTNAKSDLKQEIGLILKPFSIDSIAKRVVNLLNDAHGPLNNEFERYFYEKEKLKTTSVVSYGVRPLVNFSSEDSLYSVWKHPNKEELKEEKNSALLAEYVDFCAGEINHIISGVKAAIPKSRWTADRKVAGRFLTTTNINGLIGCLRRLAKEKKLKTVQQYITAFSSISTFKFDKYKSSQYNRMAQDLYDRFFT